VYLKTLTIKGFKSFADSTTIELEPGVTVVVGPNGSGKSNVVDAVAWVLGAQGPRVVRSAKMDDVIFAGTERRAALGRAEVSLTIDNTARRLPIEFNEVTVTRTLFRTGESEYAINGAPCRLLDVQELLSDSGVGRQQHVIIGQGQLDAVLTARPEDRRAIIEEAAGVLKYRRRRERAERRLEASESALARLQDLVGEVGRQLKPLTRQAAAALRHDELAAEQRALRLHLARTELGDLSERLSSGARRREELDEETAITGADLARTWAALSLAEEGEGQVPAEDLEPLARRLDDQRQRARQLLALCHERRRSVASLVAALPSVDEVAALEAESARCATDLARALEEIDALGRDWDALVSDEAALALDDQDHVDRFGADAVLLAASPAIGEARAAAAAGRDELARARELHARTAERAEAIGARVRETDERRERHVAAAQAAQAALEQARATDAELAGAAAARRAESAEVDERLRVAEEAAHAAEARVEALELALDEARARAGVERLAELPGVVGTLLDVVAVADRAGLAFEAALEGALAGVLVAGDAEARAALDLLRRDGLGGAVLPMLAPRTRDADIGAAAPHPTPPSGCEELRSSVTSSDPAVEHLLDRLLDGVLVCHGGLDEALDAHLASPRSVVVTPAGDRLSEQGWRLGAGRAGATRAALEAARSRAEGAREALAELTAAAATSAGAAEEARAAADAAARALDSMAADHRRDAEQVAELTAALEMLLAERVRVDAEHAAASSAVEAAAVALAELGARLEVLERSESEVAARREEAAAARAALEARAQVLRGRRAQLEVRSATLEERRALLVVRAEELDGRVVVRREAQAVAGERRSRYERDDRAIERLAAAAAASLTDLDAALSTVAAERERREAAAAARVDRLRSLRSRRDALERVLAGVRERGQRLEVEMTESRVRHEAALAALGRDLGVAPEDLGEAPLPSLGAEQDAAARLALVDAELGKLGPVNPLARDELAALEERSAFLAGQLEDVRSARRELGQVIDGVDREIVEIFTTAFADVAHHFSDLFTTLFPGGTGRLVLTAPDDPLSTGIEIDARPAGRNVRRLSLLSGGERSLVAMAFLFAVFRSRPSPFYMMDEVEAALDEVNLRRFLDLVEEFRDEAQLVIVSHQKRTMEIADALFGVSMQPGGSSKVVSERIRGRSFAAAAAAERASEAT